MIAVLWLLELIVLLITVLIISKVDIMSPSALMIIGYIIGVITFLAMQSYWQIDFGWGPFALESLGLFAFIIPEFLTQRIGLSSLVYHSRPNAFSVDGKDISDNVNYVLVTVTILAQLFTTYWTIKQLKDLSGVSGLSNIIATYRNGTSASGEMIKISTGLSFLQKLTLAFSFVFMFEFFTKYRRKKIKFLFLIPVLMTMLQQLFMGGRLQIFRIIIMGTLIYYLLLRQENDWSLSSVKKIVRIALIIIVVSIPVFYVLKFMLGRSSTEGLVPYILRYLGGSTGAFAIYVNDGMQRSIGLGRETFMGVFDFLSRRNGVSGIINLPWAVSNTGATIGNVYGANRRFIADYGVWGIVWLNAVMGSLYGFFYGNVRKKLKESISPILITIYAYLVYATFFQFIEGYFYFSVLTVNTVAQIILIVFAFYFMRFLSRLRVDKV